MSLRPIYGHQPLLDRLAGTIAASRFPQATLLVGPVGVGKQRLALWVAQGMLCDRGPGAPCGECAACRQVDGLRHPDVHWFIPVPRPKAGDPRKQLEEAEENLGAVMEERRADPLWRRPDGMASHGLASVRLLHRRVALTPFSGKRKVVILGDAERLIVQEASQEAANALLKVLEEPPADTWVILTTAEPLALLPTIRSRLVSLRVPRVSDGEVRRFLERELDPAPTGAALERRTLLAEGSIGRALWTDDEEVGPDRAAQELLEAVRGGQRRWLPLALAQQPWAARGNFTATLDAVAVRIRRELRDAGDLRPATVRQRLAALRSVESARDAAQGNANPQLLLVVLGAELERLS